MSGVDVLAELDRRIAISRELCVVRDITDTPPGLADLIEARAAVAELAEVADEAYAELAADSTRDGPRCLLLTRLEAALARCRGGAA